MEEEVVVVEVGVEEETPGEGVAAGNARAGVVGDLVAGDASCKRNSWDEGSRWPSSTTSLTGFVMRILLLVMLTSTPFLVSTDIDTSLHGNKGEMRQLENVIFCWRPCSSRQLTTAVPILCTVNWEPAAVTCTSQGRMLTQSCSSKVAQEVAPESSTQASTCWSTEVRNTKLPVLSCLLSSSSVLRSLPGTKEEEVLEEEVCATKALV